ncbi:hypothetical protein O181_048674 [Austropuccinia psidii MF-1]|uniref:Major facilitator superfamily (MFS) profile domain-containing protein n=1 Tax=Austropuccinia psidii MF-1 TaxID=1389203 RepID=A0A9Q3HN51_9BASI|nr:hypothetical protein [Austropuccinia psidii MF-1]
MASPKLTISPNEQSSLLSYQSTQNLQAENLTKRTSSSSEHVQPDLNTVDNQISVPNQSQRAQTPLPIKQLSILCLMRLTEPISFTVIFPFINQLIEELNVGKDRTQVGSYAGLIESLFAMSQLCTVLFWGSLSDKIGRKPVLISGLMGLAIGIISFGLQRTFIGLVITRSFAGGMNGNIAAIKSALAEITDDTNKAFAFALVPLTYALGLTIGPAIGGYASQPAKQYPNSIFAQYSFFQIYPYFLPCFLSGMFNLMAVCLGAFYLEETLPSKKRGALKQKNISQVGASESGATSSENETLKIVPPWRDFLVKPIVIRLTSYGLVAFENAAWLAIVPVFCYTRIEDGGLGLNLNQIGTILSSNGIVALFIQLLIFPPLQKKMGTVRLFRLVKPPVLFSFMSLPLIQLFTKKAYNESGPYTQIAMISMILILGIKSISNMGVACATILINDAAPNRASLGTINGLGQSFASLSRSIAPFLIGKLFSMSLAKESHGFFQKNFVWLFSFLISTLGVGITWALETEKSSKSLANQRSQNCEESNQFSNHDDEVQQALNKTKSYGTI